MAKRILIWGTHDTGKARVRIMREGLAASSITIHTPVWESVRDKSQLRTLSWLRYGWRLLCAYPRMIWRYLNSPAHKIVIVGYPGLLDVIILWPFATFRGASIYWDMFTSAYDTLTQDRRRFSQHHPMSYLIYTLEWLACRACRRLILDTAIHAERIAHLYGLPVEKCGYVPVGCSTIFKPIETNQSHDRFRVVFIGQFIPLHGIQTILDAIALCQDGQIEWQIIGSGQDDPLLQQFIRQYPNKPVDWTPWLPYEALPKSIAQADACLGIFGTSDKATSVIPNKIYEALACGKPIITRDSPAIRELPNKALEAITLIPPDNPHALLEATLALKTNPKPIQPFASHDLAANGWRALISR